ncbi:HIRAN domain-containing protein [Bacillus sp. CMF12]|uniref:HIRAN domain-containing protein n=1 Tax=Bacillus sp. CMF12 TaxID=2884834 RepID=UPI00207A4C46|nr:HIRAN domain-containing protein [Bacillus sp. CMF12]USK48030.1 HIRAN domain-containing protein [Bacillus sp. CMF12]
MNIPIRLSGVTYEGRQSVIARISEYDSIYLERDYHNRFDENAIGVFHYTGVSIGWIPREVARFLAPQMDDGATIHAKILRIVGGNDLSYGVEIILEKEESLGCEIQPNYDVTARRRAQQQVLDFLNNYQQSQEESERDMLEFNAFMQKSYETKILQGDVDGLQGLINRGWLTVDNIQHFAEHCFQTGQFENSYKSLLTLRFLARRFNREDLSDFLLDNISMFHSFGFDKPLPEQNDFSYPQSIERFDESYVELDIIHELLNGSDHLLDVLKRERYSYDIEVRADALFAMGEMFFLQQEFEKTLDYYLQAIVTNPNKALYWGYTAQVMNRNDVHPIICSRYIFKAIELDEQNPRWHFLQAIFLAKMHSEEQLESFLEHAVYELQLAYQLLRPEQAGLRKAILIFMGKEEHLSSK